LVLLLLLAAHLGGVGIHVVVDMLRHLVFRGKAPTAIGHRTAERTISLRGERKIHGLELEEAMLLEAISQ